MLEENHLAGVGLDDVFNHEGELAGSLREGCRSDDPEAVDLLQLDGQPTNVILTPPLPSL